jgi:hypothetical protein
MSGFSPIPLYQVNGGRTTISGVSTGSWTTGDATGQLGPTSFGVTAAVGAALTVPTRPPMMAPAAESLENIFVFRFVFVVDRLTLYRKQRKGGTSIRRLGKEKSKDRELTKSEKEMAGDKGIHKGKKKKKREKS